jgi:hypothetical protein
MCVYSPLGEHGSRSSSQLSISTRPTPQSQFPGLAVRVVGKGKQAWIDLGGLAGYGRAPIM